MNKIEPSPPHIAPAVPLTRRLPAPPSPGSWLAQPGEPGQDGGEGKSELADRLLVTSSFLCPLPLRERADAERPGEGNATRHNLAPYCRALALAAVLALAACEGTPFHDDLTAQTFEAASLQFGEASDRNRAAIVASRRDLRKPRQETPADATRRDTIISDYRNGAAQPRTAPPAGTGEQP